MSSQQSSSRSAYSTTTSSPAYQYQYQYYEQQHQQQSQWMKVIPIEDEELTFGGKPLSDLYEEDRRRYSNSSFDSNETRGRTRQRAYEPELLTSHGHGHGHHKHHHHHHKKSEKKK